MATQLMQAREGIVTEEMREVAASEGLDPERVRDGVARGHIVIPHNVRRSFRAVGIGAGLTTKVNANIGASGLRNRLDDERDKLRAAVEAGAHSVMDLSVCADLNAIREQLLAECPVMFGTVPIYQLASEIDVLSMRPDELFACIEGQARQGVDFMTVHCGVTRATLERLQSRPRLAGIVSRGGALMAAYIQTTGEENPLYAQFDRLCDILAEHDVTFSLGDGLRPGALADASDPGQIAELTTMGELCRRARRRGCQVMIEGPGHVPLHLVAENVALEKRLCDGAPFYVLGPLTTDVAPGYDHITAAIGGAAAAAAGADFLCYVTPAEHLRLPDRADVVEGVVAARIAAHSGDIAKGVARAREWDDQMSTARKTLDWEGMFRLAIDPAKARRYRAESEAAAERVCTMCGSLCAVDLDNRLRISRAGGEGKVRA